MARGISKDYLNDLAKVPLFSECTKEELEIIAGLGTEVEVEDGRVFMIEGDVAQEAFLVREGEAVCTKDGKELARFGPGGLLRGDGSHRARSPERNRHRGDGHDRAGLPRQRVQPAHARHPPSAVKILMATAQRLLSAEDAPTH